MYIQGRESGEGRRAGGRVGAVQKRIDGRFVIEKRGRSERGKVGREEGEGMAENVIGSLSSIVFLSLLSRGLSSSRPLGWSVLFVMSVYGQSLGNTSRPYALCL